MGIKDLFDKGYSLKSIKKKNQENIREDLESVRYIDAYAKRKHRFFPDVDFTTASNFARFGLAEEYYDTAVKRIYQTYPYDGSRAEKLEWENEGTYLDIFIFENEYPRTNGFVTFNSISHTYTSTEEGNIYSSSAPQYIYFTGGPHADTQGDYKSNITAGPSHKGASKTNIYDTASQRTNNLEIDPDKGLTVEFWMKKDGWASEDVLKYEYIFNIAASGSTGDDYGNLRIYSYGLGSGKSHLILKIESGSSDVYTATHATGLDDVADGKWHHYAVTYKQGNSKLYVDGTHQSEQTDSSINSISGKLIAALGALASPRGTSLSLAGRGWGNIVSTSFDEFRYWKTERDAQQIGRYYRDQIGGGTNTDNVKYDDVTNKVDLGVYYKFNEGITGVSTTDSVILDYSGRISNGTFINYSSGCRNINSAIVLSSAATKEFQDPIIYSYHPDVSTLLENKKKIGRMHDHTNPASLYKSVPGWILEEDESESNHLKYLMQILSSYFDDLYMQIEKLPNLRNINYPDDTKYEKPLPFAERLLESRGYDAPELFAHASALAQFLDRDEKKLFEKKLYEVKNIIYQNIYNNLVYIQKSKGTYKSLRNFLRCFGVDEELVKLNLYAKDDEYELKDNFVNTALRKKFIDFDDSETRMDSTGNRAGAFSATAYQYKNPSVNNTISYIPAISANQMSGAAMTIEAEVIFPKRAYNDVNHQVFPSLNSSIFGMHAVKESDEDLSYATDDTINFNFRFEKADTDKNSGLFSLVSSTSNDILSTLKSEKYLGVYDNQKWNLAFRLRPTKNTFSNLVSASLSPASSAYTYEIYGNNYLSDIIQEEFAVSGTISLSQASKFFSAPKRIFIGAKRTNFTGSVQLPSDVKVSSVRAWYSYLDNDMMRGHGRFSDTYGVTQPLKNSNLTDAGGFLGTKIPQIETLILNWSMDNLTGSDANGQFLINDFSSGSSDVSKYGTLTPVLEKNYSGRGDFFVSTEAYRDQAIDIEFVQTAKQKLPEIVNSDDMIKILNRQDDVQFTRETTYVQHLLSIEKSMYQVISDEMMRFFSSVSEFNNLIGEPINRYRPYYKKMEKLREMFFRNVESDLDLEKFIEYYKWIDDAVTLMIAQLIPASANSVELLRNMVESHVLERNKYWTKFPTIDTVPHNPIASLKGIEEYKYNWKFGHAPVGASQNSNQSQNCLWWKQRADRAGVLSSGIAGVDSSKHEILKTIVTEVSGTTPTLKTPAGAKYVASYYPNRSLSRPYDMEASRLLNLKGGSNPNHTKRHDLYKNIIKWGSDDDFIYIDADSETPKVDCNDKIIPDEINKKLFRVKTLTMLADQTIGSDATGGGANDKNYDDAKSALLLPFSMYSSSIDTGYRQAYAGGSMPKIEFANMHDDKYGFDTEVPMQGPFTEKYVGGLQHRHVDINKGTDGQLTRPEGWHLQEFMDNSGSPVTILYEQFLGATTTATTDVNILSLPADSTSPDPSPYEYWRNGVGTDNQWTFLQGTTPSVGTGPTTANRHAYCEVLPSKVGQTFGLVTPLIDLLEYDVSSTIFFQFSYHMHGLHIGNLKVQASSDPNFQIGVENLLVDWGSFNSTVISGQQHTNAADGFSTARASSTPGNGLASWLGKRFYIRFLYTAGISHLGDCAIREPQVFEHSLGVERNSFKLLNPTHDNHHRPSAIYTRQQYAKRPVNIRNIHMTGNSPTVAGNYLNRYEYISTVSPEANDPFFVKNIHQIKSTTPELLMIHKIENLLSTPPGAYRTNLSYRNFQLPDRSYLADSIKNKTRIMTRFSSPGGFETLSRGFLDPAHETYAVNNVMTYRNMSSRMIYNSQLQAHCGRFGVSTHEAATARVFGSETSGTINSTDYTIVGDASKHKHHRNNIERIEFTGDSPNPGTANTVFVTASSYDNAFISHMIPRTEQQTRWITGSLI